MFKHWPAALLDISPISGRYESYEPARPIGERDNLVTYHHSWIPHTAIKVRSAQDMTMTKDRTNPLTFTNIIYWRICYAGELILSGDN